MPANNKPRVCRDPASPNFEHGIAAGYQRGCTTDAMCPSTPSCRKARARKRDLRELQRLRGVPVRADADLIARVIRHVDRLLMGMPGACDANVASAAGVDPSATLSKLRSGKGCALSTARKLLAVTPETLAPHRLHVPVEDSQRLVRIMQADGYPLAWQQRQSGCSLIDQLWVTRTRDGKERQFTSPALYESIRALYERIQGSPADGARDGIRPGARTTAMKRARALGYFPSALYDDDLHVVTTIDGTPDWRRLPGHKWAEVTDHAGRTLDAIDLMLRTGGSSNEVGDEAGVSAQTLLRVRRAIGFVYPRATTAHEIGKPPPLDRERSADALARFADVYARYSDGQIDPVHGLFELGALTLRDTGIPSDHPARSEYLAANPEIAQREQDAYDAMQRRRTDAARAALNAKRLKKEAA